MRVRVFLIAIMLGLGLFGQASFAAQESGNDVPMYRGNPARTGEMPGPGPNPAIGIAEIWSFSVGGPDNAYWLPPAIVGGVVYIGGPDGLYALDATSGDERWRFATEDEIESSPAVVDGNVYFSGGEDGLIALDAASGAERWRFAPDSIFRSPAVVGGVIYVTGEKTLYAVDAASGAERWRFVPDHEVDLLSRSTPAVAGGMVYVGSPLHDLFAIDAASGEERWRYVGDCGLYTEQPVVANGMVYVPGADNEGVCALDAESGEERWRIGLGIGIHAFPAVVGGNVYVTGGHSLRAGGLEHLFAIDASVGEERWRFEIGEVQSGVQPAIDAATAYLGGGEVLYAVDLASGEESWHLKVEGGVASSPVVVDGLVFVISGDGFLYALGAKPIVLNPGGVAVVREEVVLRGAPAASGIERATVNPGISVEIVERAYPLDGGVWWLVRVIETDQEGWVPTEVLEPTANAT